MSVGKTKWRWNIRRTTGIVSGVIGLCLLGLGILLFVHRAAPGSPVGHISFDTYPDGTPITAERILRGDEFLEAGIRLAGAPEHTYCAGATAAAIRLGGRYGNISFHFLTTSQPNEIDICNGSPVEITFTESVHQVKLVFAGASQKYELSAYDEGGKLLGSSQAEAVFGGGTFEASFRSKRADIKRVTFGGRRSLTAIKEIIYEH